jgi:hypothetical protein
MQTHLSYTALSKFLSFNRDRKLVEIEGEPIVIFNIACQYFVNTSNYSYDLQWWLQGLAVIPVVTNQATLRFPTV